MKACVVKFFKKLWSILTYLFCFAHCRHHDDAEETANE